jgi:hypothetical protein
MNRLLSRLVGTKTLVYLDDIIVWGANLQEHNAKLIEVFGRLRSHTLKLQADKCEFMRTEVCYLGHRITAEGFRPDELKEKALRDFPVPTKTKQLRAFLGLTGYYRKFVSRFSPIAK